MEKKRHEPNKPRPMYQGIPWSWVLLVTKPNDVEAVDVLLLRHYVLGLTYTVVFLEAVVIWCHVPAFEIQLTNILHLRKPNMFCAWFDHTTMVTSPCYGWHWVKIVQQLGRRYLNILNVNCTPMMFHHVYWIQNLILGLTCLETRPSLPHSAGGFSTARSTTLRSNRPSQRHAHFVSQIGFP